MTVPVFRCAACNAYFSDGGRVNYDDVDPTAYCMACAGLFTARYGKVFAEMSDPLAPCRFLDIGAGMGFSLEVAQRHGGVRHGLEPDLALVRHAAGRGLRVEHGSLDDTRQDLHAVILIDNVLEHVPDPAAFLHDTSRLLAPSALMLVAIPPLDWLRNSLAALPYVRNLITEPQINVFGEIGEYVNIFSRRALARLAQRVSLQLLPKRSHHSRVFKNAVFRALGMDDDGYYFMTAREAGP